MPKNIPDLLWFKDISHDDIPIAGGKGANLGEMYGLGIPVPNGFVVTSSAYFKFVEANGLQEKIRDVLRTTDIDHPDQLLSASKRIKALIKKGDMAESLAINIMKSYRRLSGLAGLSQVRVAIRSSATAEDLPDASFAGQQETFLDVVGEANVLRRVQDCWASLFTPRAIFYREKKKFNHFKVGIAVPIQKMVASTVSGIMFTVNPVTNDKNQIIVETIWGLGEYIVQGKVTPDQHIVNRSDWTVASKTQAKQTIQLVRSADETKEVPVARAKQEKFKIDEKTAVKIAKVGQKLHDHYRQPQDIEFALEGNRLYIVQTRPITTIISNQKTLDKQGEITQAPDLKGDPASPGIGAGVVVIINSPKEIGRAQKGNILVTRMTTPDFVPAMKKVSGIITDEGGQTSHAAIVSRELGVPCVVGTGNATKLLHQGDLVTLNGATGAIWRGDLSSQIQTSPDLSKTANPNLKTATKVLCNLGEPDLAAEIAKRNVDGVGLLRAEFMIANIGTHPKKMIADGQQKKYIRQLADGLRQFCQSFNPRPVIYRATDFKTNEYRFLKWGKLYEPEEPNPMLGFRGASRYISSPDVFLMELEAIKIIRNHYGLKNLWLMIPFVRTPRQLAEVKKIIAAAGLLRSPSFKLFMMVEIPSNVIRLEKFIEVGIDGISIGSNDLTMLTLGLDRDNSQVAPDFNEMDPAVLWSLKRAITKARKHGLMASICGQAPSNYPDLVEKLVKWGVTSISVSPDAIDRTRQIVAWAEKRKILKKAKKK